MVAFPRSRSKRGPEGRITPRSWRKRGRVIDSQMYDGERKDLLRAGIRKINFTQKT